MSAEAIVALTDYALALECAVFACVLGFHAQAWTALRRHFVVFFLATALASLTGGLYHAFFPGAEGLAADALWKATMLAIGVTAFAALRAAAELVGRGLRPVIRALAWIELVAYGGYVLLFDDRFVVAFVDYAPAAAILALAFVEERLESRNRAVTAGLAGLVVMGLAALGQNLGIAVHPEHFNHNATYHLVQGVGLALLFASARPLSCAAASSSHPAP